MKRDGLGFCWFLPFERLVCSFENSLLLGSSLRIPEGDFCPSLTQHVIPARWGSPIHICTSCAIIFSDDERHWQGVSVRGWRHNQSLQGVFPVKGWEDKGGWLHF